MNYEGWCLKKNKYAYICSPEIPFIIIPQQKYQSLGYNIGYISCINVTLSEIPLKYKLCILLRKLKNNN